MKITIAQTRPESGDILANIERHQHFIARAVARGATMIIFPELSLSGYEPSLAADLAVTPEDPRFHCFQEMSDQQKIIIGAGAPIVHGSATAIGMLLFQPHKKPAVYFKQYLHKDETPFFIPGQDHSGIIDHQPPIALAICYELSVAAHAEQADQNGAGIYIASVAKSASGVQQASERLASIARQYGMTVLMANCLGRCDDMDCVGNSAIWDSEGNLQRQLNSAAEGVLILDTISGKITEEIWH